MQEVARRIQSGYADTGGKVDQLQERKPLGPRYQHLQAEQHETRVQLRTGVDTPSGIGYDSGSRSGGNKVGFRSASPVGFRLRSGGLWGVATRCSMSTIKARASCKCVQRVVYYGVNRIPVALRR
eukprot:SAG31_NODE_1042_length_10187_cov_54.452121_17_plen_125_part_00